MRQSCGTYIRVVDLLEEHTMEIRLVTAPVQQILDSFDALPDADKHQAAVEILRRVTGEKDMAEDALVELADELFCTLDEEESGHAPP